MPMTNNKMHFYSRRSLQFRKDVYFNFIFLFFYFYFFDYCFRLETLDFKANNLIFLNEKIKSEFTHPLSFSTFQN